MKITIATILLACILASCGKNNDVKPISNSTNTITIAGSSTTTSNNSTVPMTHDDSLHLVIFNIKDQQVKTAVSGSTLTLTLNENVDIYLTAEGYAQTSSLHLLESLNHTLLAGFDYTTMNEEGQTTLNWVDDNLNNVKLKTVTDTVVNNIKFVKVNVSRPFTFFKTYNSAGDAVAYQSYLLTDVSDIITFSSYCYYNQKVYQTSSAVGHVVYSK
jgi:hypothetical protein